MPFVQLLNRRGVLEQVGADQDLALCRVLDLGITADDIDPAPEPKQRGSAACSASSQALSSQSTQVTSDADGDAPVRGIRRSAEGRRCRERQRSPAQHLKHQLPPASASYSSRSRRRRAPARRGNRLQNPPAPPFPFRIGPAQKPCSSCATSLSSGHSAGRGRSQRRASLSAWRPAVRARHRLGRCPATGRSALQVCRG